MNLFDPIAEPGHLEFNKIMNNHYRPHAHFELKVSEADRKNKVKFYYRCLLNHINLINKTEQGDVWLIFDTVCLFLLTWFRRFNGVQFVVHNNLDFALKSGIKKYFYKVIASRCNLIYLEHRLAQAALQHFKHRGASVLQHPLIPVPGKYNPTNTAFVSSRNITGALLSDICDIESSKQVICNKVITGVEKSNLKMGYIPDFNAMLLSCEKVYIVGDYRLRASGILYKALSIKGLTLVFEDPGYYKEINDLVLQAGYNCKLELLKLN